MPFTTLAAPVGSSVKCSSPGHGRLTQIPGWQPRSSPLQTLAPFIPAPPPPPAAGTPHNGSVATVTDISMLLMLTVVLCVVCWYPKKDLHKREPKKTAENCNIVPSYDSFQTNIFHILSEQPFAQETKEPL